VPGWKVLYIANEALFLVFFLTTLFVCVLWGYFCFIYSTFLASPWKGENTRILFTLHIPHKKSSSRKQSIEMPLGIPSIPGEPPATPFTDGNTTPDTEPSPPNAKPEEKRHLAWKK
jgi:hypothetical protein